MAKTGATQSLPVNHFKKSLGETVNLSQMAMKPACKNSFWEYSSRDQELLQLV